MFKIGNIVVDNNVVLAPMAGVSNPAYMKICEEMGVGYSVTELISSEAIVRNNKKTFDMLKGIENLQKPFAIQIFGNNPDTMAKAARIIEKKFKPSIIDINFGCPVPKVAVKAGSGSALLKSPGKIYDIVTSVVNVISIPVTVKIRSGWDDNSINAEEVARICEKAGSSAIVVHPRTRKQGYTGKADWNIIKKVKEAVTIPVIGNGDIKDIYDAKRMFDETGCDAVMIGRAVLGNPWIIKECIEYIGNETIINKPNNNDKIDMLKKHYRLLKKYSSEKKALLEIRSHALWYIKGMKNIKKYKQMIVSLKTEKEFLEMLTELEKK